MRVYHVVSTLDTDYPDLASASKALAKLQLIPAIPQSMCSGEDRSIPRICVAKSVEDCITGIGVGHRFHRCLEAEDAYSYVSRGREVYPIGILEIEIDPEDLVTPTVDQVDDASFTHELWITSDRFDIVSRKLVWIDQFSISLDEEEFISEKTHIYSRKCKSIKYTNRPEPGKHHPWIDGRGSVLASKEEEPWYDDDARHTCLFSE